MTESKLITKPQSIFFVKQLMYLIEQLKMVEIKKKVLFLLEMNRILEKLGLKKNVHSPKMKEM